jgi:hypothetical protein
MGAQAMEFTNTTKAVRARITVTCVLDMSAQLVME